MNQKDKNILIIAGVVLVVVLVGFFLLRGRGGQTALNREEVLPTSEVIPTVDASVRVSVTANKKKTEVELAINGIPKGTQTIEYELSYNTEGDIPKGTAASPTDVSGQSSYSKTITLGTCSSGSCVYDKVTGPIKVTIKFDGSYGKKLFEKEFDI